MMKAAVASCGMSWALIGLAAAEHPQQSRMLIIGGEVATDPHPYMASLTSSHSHNCGGTLIAPDIIMTAAHCVQSDIGNVQLGRFNLSDETEIYESFAIASSVTHPQAYNNLYIPGDVDAYDVGLFKLYGRSNQSFVVINRNDSYISGDEELLVLGWGNIDVAETQLSDVLRQTNLAYIPNNVCIKASEGRSSDDTTSLRADVVDVVLCAADFVVPPSDACSGDSGGPLLYEGVQVGIVSSGYGCLSPDLPSLNVRVSWVSKWIDEKVCELSNYPPDDFGCPVGENTESGISNGTLVDIDLVIQLGDLPEEIGWVLELADLVTGKRRTIAERPIFSYMESGATVSETLSVPDDAFYVFTLVDSYGDGGALAYINIGSTSMCDITFTGGYKKGCQFSVGKPRTLSPTSSPAPTPFTDAPFLTIDIDLDRRPVETGYLVELLNGTDRDEVAAAYPGTFPASLSWESVTRRIVLLPTTNETQLYRFTMLDNEQDGLSGGRYRVWFGDKADSVLMFEGGHGDFYAEESHTFSIPYDNATRATPPATSSMDYRFGLKSVMLLCWHFAIVFV